MVYWKIRRIWKRYRHYFWGDNFDVRYYLCEKISHLKNQSILDIGCNIGIISGCADETNTILGIDLDKKAIAIAKELYPHNTYRVQDLWTLTRKQFDVVLLANMIEMFPKEQRANLMVHVASFLKKGGILYLTTPNKDNAYYRQHVNKLTLQELLGYLEPHFIVEHVVLWNPISINVHHFGFLPGIYILMKPLSFLFKRKSSVSLYIKARKC